MSWQSITIAVLMTSTCIVGINLAAKLTQLNNTLIALASGRRPVDVPRRTWNDEFKEVVEWGTDKKTPPR